MSEHLYIRVTPFYTLRKRRVLILLQRWRGLTVAGRHPTGVTRQYGLEAIGGWHNADCASLLPQTRVTEHSLIPGLRNSWFHSLILADALLQWVSYENWLLQSVCKCKQHLWNIHIWHTKFHRPNLFFYDQLQKHNCQAINLTLLIRSNMKLCIHFVFCFS